jgi:hypothetical protein
MVKKCAVASLLLFAIALMGTSTATARSPYLYIGEVKGVHIYGKVTDQNGKPLQARIETWYPKIGYVTEERGKPVPRKEQSIRQLFHADYSNEKGWYMVSTFPGDWLVRVTAGPEYTTKEFIVNTTKDQTSGQCHDISLTRLYDLRARGWYSIDVHHHSFYSHGIQRPRQVYEAAKSLGLDALILTDHNAVSQCPEWFEYGDDRFLALCGVEISTKPAKTLGPHKGNGHNNAIGVTKLPGAKDPGNPNWSKRYIFDSCQDNQRAIDETHAMGGLYAINHPMQARHRPDGTFSCWGEVRNFDAIEIHNGGYGAGPFTTYLLGTNPARSDYWNVDTLSAQAWFEFLNAGNKIAAWGSSDSHDHLELREPGTQTLDRWNKITGNGRTYVHARDLSWSAMKDALKRGNAFVSNGAYGLLLFVDSKGKEPGDEVRVGEDGIVPLTIEILSNRPLEGYKDGIRIIQAGKIIKTIPTEAGAWTMKIKTEVKIDTQKDTWLVVQAFGQWPSMAITNAIYLDVVPHGKWGAAEWTFPKGAATWNNPWPVVPEITVPDGPSRPPYPQPEPAIGYNRPMSREIAERLLTEEYKDKNIAEDVKKSRVFEYIK